MSILSFWGVYLVELIEELLIDSKLLSLFRVVEFADQCVNVLDSTGIIPVETPGSGDLGSS